MMTSLVTEIENKRLFGELVCQKLQQCIEQLGFPTGVINSYPQYQSANFELIKDPFTGIFNLSGFWTDKHGHKIGRLQFQSDESCYAEYSVGLTHPTKSQWFVDNVMAWGKTETLTAEASLLRLPE
jgi:hypothetical protein